jgi:hypothetical protein
MKAFHTNISYVLEIDGFMFCLDLRRVFSSPARLFLLLLLLRCLPFSHARPLLPLASLAIITYR